VLASLAEHYEHTHPDRAAALLDTALSHDPTHEPTATHLIHIHLRHNRPEAAHRVYTNLAEHLADLGQTPRQATTNALRAEPIPTTRPHTTGPAVA
jgi:DNA-binding SARP family transcriptional activator